MKLNVLCTKLKECFFGKRSIQINRQMCRTVLIFRIILHLSIENMSLKWNVLKYESKTEKMSQKLITLKHNLGLEWNIPRTDGRYFNRWEFVMEILCKQYGKVGHVKLKLLRWYWFKSKRKIDIVIGGSYTNWPNEYDNMANEASILTPSSIQTRAVLEFIKSLCDLFSHCWNLITHLLRRVFFINFVDTFYMLTQNAFDFIITDIIIT